MKKKDWMLLGLLLGAFILWNALLLVPQPIIRNPDNANIRILQYNHGYGTDVDGYIEVTEYAEQELLKYLSQCKERRLWAKSDSYWIGNVEIALLVDTGGISKYLLLGKTCVRTGGSEDNQYEILEGHAVREMLLQWMEIPPMT